MVAAAAAADRDGYIVRSGSGRVDRQQRQVFLINLRILWEQ